jgi:hypothetical protein
MNIIFGFLVALWLSVAVTKLLGDLLEPLSIILPGKNPKEAA